MESVVFRLPDFRADSTLIYYRYPLDLYTPMATHLSSKEDYESLLDKYDTWMFDCDGVLWHGDRPIDGAVDVLDTLRKRGKHTLYTLPGRFIHIILQENGSSL